MGFPTRLFNEIGTKRRKSKENSLRFTLLDIGNPPLDQGVFRIYRFWCRCASAHRSELRPGTLIAEKWLLMDRLRGGGQIFRDMGEGYVVEGVVAGISPPTTAEENSGGFFVE